MRKHSPRYFANIKNYTLNHAKTLVHLLRRKMNLTLLHFASLYCALNYIIYMSSGLYIF